MTSTSSHDPQKRVTSVLRLSSTKICLVTVVDKQREEISYFLLLTEEVKDHI